MYDFTHWIEANTNTEPEISLAKIVIDACIIVTESTVKVKYVMLQLNMTTCMYGLNDAIL